MYVILDDSNVIIGFEKRDVPLENLVHLDFVDHYIPTDDETLKIGDVYNRETKTFAITPVLEAEPELQNHSLSEVEQTQLEAALNIEYLICLTELND